MRASSLLMVLGLILIAAGALWRWAPWTLSWFGNLPGDIRHRGENTTVFFPITSMIVISIVLSLLLSLLRRGT